MNYNIDAYFIICRVGAKRSEAPASVGQFFTIFENISENPTKLPFHRRVTRQCSHKNYPRIIKNEIVTVSVPNPVAVFNEFMKLKQNRHNEFMKQRYSYLAIIANNFNSS